MTLGIIDVGTNSIHLVVGIVGMRGAFHVLVKERELAKLGAGGLAKRHLTRASMHRALRVLRRYAALMARCRVDHIEAVATSAVREADNGRDFVRHVRTRLGIPLRIISGREEARLIYLGVWHTQRFRHGAALLAIGGGSVQLAIGTGSTVLYTASVPLGAARLAEQFIHHDPVQPEELARLNTAIHHHLKPLTRATRYLSWRQAVGSSAMIEQITTAAYTVNPHQAHAHPRLRTLSRPALKRFLEWLVRSRAAQRRQLPGLDPKRQELSLPTALVLWQWMEICDITHLRYAPGSLREGLALDDMHRQTRRRGHAAEALTRLSIRRLALVR